MHCITWSPADNCLLSMGTLHGGASICFYASSLRMVITELGRAYITYWALMDRCMSCLPRLFPSSPLLCYRSPNFHAYRCRLHSKQITVLLLLQA